MTIELQGSSAGKSAIFDKTKHVKLSDGYYEKSDSDYVVNINGRYYRRNSPLICELSSVHYGKGQFALIEECVEDGLYGGYIYKCDSSTIESEMCRLVDGAIVKIKPPVTVYYKIDYSAIRVFNKSSSSGFSEIYIPNNDAVRAAGSELLRRGSNGRYYFPEDTVALHPRYGAAEFVGVPGIRPPSATSRVVDVDSFINNYLIMIDGHYHYKSHISWSVDKNGNNYKPIENNQIGVRIDKRPNPFSAARGLSSTVRDSMNTIVRVSNSGGSSAGTIRSALNEVLKMGWFQDTRLDSDFAGETFQTSFGFPVGIKGDAILIDKIAEIASNQFRAGEVSKIIASGVWFGNLHNEPLPEMFTNCSVGNQGGDYVYNLNKSNFIGSNYKGTGGIGYTFGVEIETNKGVIPLEVARSLPVDCVGDRSIGALEYVTGVLSGDEGMSYPSCASGGR